ncbi:sensor domain-containing diguanylate cyclase [Chromobacterium sp. Beijing]|uniref:sensor domain-containing diguanylate cyclase n=1 Tax=Chromobacterium sp. Beijing TaxID=2735795 RepID=UPI001F20CFE3|nr:sensor domain-containing diguanylate cyclase [Chromobacterium sp. Beijing]UJB33473.1 diguanylate cyclase [Chromobacterium sp. Beijing]
MDTNIKLYHPIGRTKMKLLSQLSPRSFRLRLSLLFGGLFLLASLLDTALEPQLNQGLLQDKGEALQATARGIAKSLAAGLSQRRRELALHTQTPVFLSAPLDSPALRGGLEHIRLHNPDYAWLGVIAPDGRIVSASGKAPSPRIEFAAPLHDEAGKLRGALAAQSAWAWVATLIAERLPRGSAGDAPQVFIVNQNNTPLFPPGAPDQADMPAPLSGPGYQQGDWADGETYLYADAAIDDAPGPGWRVIVRQPPPQAFAALSRLRSALTLPGLIITLLLMIVVYRLAAAFSRPLETLARTAQRVSAGDEEADWSLRSGARELQQLAQAMRQMTAALLARRGELAAANAGLEQKVEERTEALSQAKRQLEERAAQLEQMARHDALTGLGNRMAATEWLTAEYQRYHRSRAPYSVLLLDADHFKRVNDNHGHAVGDQVLQQIAAALNGAARATDLTARYGGEEFLLLLPDTDAEGALVLAERVRAAVSAASDTVAGVVTVSIGAATARDDDATHETIVQRADEALYRAKANGRNRVEGAG